jgi:hypothetical protein
MISSPGVTSVVHAETFLTVDGLSISYFEDEPGRQSAAKLLSKGARRIVFSSLVASGQHWSLQNVLVCERRLTRMLVGPCRDFTCPHCGALYKLVRVPKFESNRLDYDRVPCVQCSRVLSPDVFMTKDSFAEPETKDEPRRIATNISKLPEQKRGRRSGLHIVNIPSRSAALHRCPMDHSDTA